MKANPAPDRIARRIFITGTGGQGILTCAKMVGECLVEVGHEVVSGQLHGMAQRGGAVQSSIMVDCGSCPVISKGKADCVLGFEPVETVRALPYMSSKTVVCLNTSPVIPFVLGVEAVLKTGPGAYPDQDVLLDSLRAVTPHVYAFDATQCAEEIGSIKCMNMVMLGCMLGLGVLPIDEEAFWRLAESRLPGKIREINAKAFQRGLQFASDLRADRPVTPS